MRFTLLSILFIVTITSSIAQRSNSLGIRLGEPYGFTYKKYFSEKSAFEAIVGTAFRSWNHNYYVNAFDHVSEYDGFVYRSHDIRNTLYIQGRYLVHNDIYIERLTGKLDWYWGLGVVLKTARVTYRYAERQPPFRDDFRDTRIDLDLGPEGILGMEYRFQNIPISVFGELGFFLELADRPLAFRILSGAGVRYRFNTVE
jgi:hypothetical protein